MQYSPKLKKAMEQIKAIIKEHDIAAFVVLHTPDYSEYLNAVSPSYSCATLEQKELRFKLKTSEVGKEKALEIAHGTASMITHFADMVGKHAILYIDALELLKTKWDIENLPGGETGHNQQNN